jgi:hypothetical protein
MVADLPERRMSAPGIVERLNIIEEVCACRVAGWIGLPVHPFLLERSKETLDCGIVPAITASAHTAGNALGREQALEVLAGILPKNEATWSRLSCFLSTVLPRSSTPCACSTFFARSIPTRNLHWVASSRVKRSYTISTVAPRCRFK